jgi:hypothetical protein
VAIGATAIGITVIGVGITGTGAGIIGIITAIIATGAEPNVMAGAAGAVPAVLRQRAG